MKIEQTVTAIERLFFEHYVHTAMEPTELKKAVKFTILELMKGNEDESDSTQCEVSGEAVGQVG